VGNVAATIDAIGRLLPATTMMWHLLQLLTYSLLLMTSREWHKTETVLQWCNKNGIHQEGSSN